MQIDLSNNCPQVAAALASLAAKVPQVSRKATLDATGVLFAGSRGLLSTRIYNVAIPKVLRRRRSGGHLGAARMVALWKRSSQLLRGEKQTLSNVGGDIIGTIDNATPYAAARHAQTKRPAHWRTEAVAQYGGSARQAFQNALDALSL